MEPRHDNGQLKETSMNKPFALTLTVCVLASAVAVHAQSRPTGAGAPTTGATQGAPGGLGRGQFVPPGPPAPVPPQVTMLRPTIDEVNRINSALKQSIENNPSADKDLLKKYE